MNFSLENARVGIIGLGYVGLPLAVEFGKKSPTIGFDINQDRIDELSAGRDSTLECSDNELAEAKYLSYTSSLQELKECNVYIVTVPTPIDEHKQPDLTPLIKASEALGTVVSEGDVVIYESTVYPGATEEDCIPVVERVSGLKFNQDFFAGYSPERINPGDKEHRVTNILKVTSGSTPEVAEYVDKLYRTIITAGTHKASSIKVAEASKVIENTQRDVNIALVNELHQIFSRLGINTKEVIDAAATKWNFMKLYPGLVGGHCISVDPYYLLHKSQQTGYIPDLMRQAREINDSMPDHLVKDFLVSLVKQGVNPVGKKVGLFGFTFKENCPDIRNTKVYDVYNSLLKMGFSVTVYDNWASCEEVQNEYGINILNDFDCEYDVAFLAVPHDEIIKHLNNVRDKYIYDFKGLI
ncbi:Vi polysaccharide biosynthesis protein VipA/TviB [Vibrio parahaemolyticus]|uniref:nucleotide sugar dehydrogenase n=1 Tax=Vibrio parahaemolyticus TaxID=670 RepID=UPI00084A3459|nr:nucleotide sugar dehydrogenase [Vibrio parahaemolyticus]ODZ53343.1 Vi polysaccharide biosynthesis protein VipA/TviB [Vibrio parahaemolyticus]HCG7966959.1 nucleotide sugar dehydrogenase [Vibrio parahaemolyticus]